jgi:hypothetical protein
MMINRKFNHTIPDFVISEFEDNAGTIGGLGLIKPNANIINMKYRK